MNADTLWRPIEVGTLSLSHRLVVPPHGGGNGNLMGSEHEFEQHCALWLAKVHGGIEWVGGGPVFVANTPMPAGFEPTGVGAHGPGFYRDPRFTSRMGEFADRVHGAGGYLSAQMVLQGGMPIGPSATYSGHSSHAIAHQMSVDEIQWLVREYAESAALALDAGVDAIELHANHDDILEWFLSPLTNLRVYDQVDDRLIATPLPPETRARPAVGDAATDSQAPPGDVPDSASSPLLDEANISDAYVAVFTPDDTVRPVIEGQLLVDLPDLQPLLDDRPTDRTIITTDGIDGTSTFRVLFLPGSPESLEAVVAVPVDDVEDTIRQLTYIFVGVAGLILLVLVVIASWLNRFGLRPISAMTDVAGAISAGERDRRAEVTDDSTEAGRLGKAFNVMLDERDAGEERLRQFVSNASHELRTPLTSIRGYLDLYAAGGFRQPGELDDAMRRLRVEAERMNLLVDDLLVLAKFDEEQPLDIASVRIDEVARDVVALALAGQSDRQIRVHAPEEIEVDADRLRLHQALAALVDNAIRHTPDDAAIQVAVARTAEHVELSVTDNGPGLSAHEAAAVFDRFSRGDRSRARKTGGSGLGLSIAQAIVQAHGGEISVAAQPGDGATFTIVLPPAT